MSGQRMEQIVDRFGVNGSQTSSPRPNLTNLGQMGLSFNSGNPANLPPPVMQNIPMQQPNYQTSMPSFEQLVGGGGYDPMASIAAMQRQPVSIPQNPFFGGAIPIDFGIPAGAMPMPAPRYSAGQANRAFEQQQAAERAAREAQAAMQLQAIYNPTPWTEGSYFDSSSAYDYAPRPWTQGSYFDASEPVYSDWNPNSNN
jgi:hypothetical protein